MNYVQSGIVLVGIRIRVSFIIHISATTSTYKVCEAKTYLLRHSIIQTQCPWLLTDDLCPAGSRKNQDKGRSNFIFHLSAITSRMQEVPNVNTLTKTFIIHNCMTDVRLGLG